MDKSSGGGNGGKKAVEEVSTTSDACANGGLRDAGENAAAAAATAAAVAAGTSSNQDDAETAQELSTRSGFTPSAAASAPATRPGAYHANPMGSARDLEDGQQGQIPGELGAPTTRRLSNETSEITIASAYLVEEEEDSGEGGGRSMQPMEVSSEPVHEAKVVQTLCGVDKKRLFGIVGSCLLLLAIILGPVIGTNPRKSNVEAATVCGGLCPAEDGQWSPLDGTDPPEANRFVLGKTCERWDADARTAPIDPNSDCAEAYGAASYGCGCQTAAPVEPTEGGCGSLCLDPTESLPYPDRVVVDINNNKMTCVEWQVRSQFESNPDECPNYNAVGKLCGCRSSVPSPDNCGPLCGPDIDDIEYPTLLVYNQPCEDWDVFSAYLPIFYGKHGETCDERYRDIARRCECPAAPLPPADCLSLCQERSLCGQLCSDGTAIPDPNKVVRGMSCLAWEFRSRMDSWEDQEELCAFHHMVGAECGCASNAPPVNACGPLCGPDDSMPDPGRQVQGNSCAEWDSVSSFLYEGYGIAMGAGNSIIPSCDEFISEKAYACGCPAALNPPVDACGSLCKDGSVVPDPNKIVGDRTCADMDLFSRFETDPERCQYLRDLVAPECGCSDDDSTNDKMASCFTLEDIALSNQTYAYFIGQNTFTVTFGDGGRFTQIQSSQFHVLIGEYFGIDIANTAAKNTARYVYGGGQPCGMYGPRRGAVVLVEDSSATEPYIENVVEPFICNYQVEMKVPSLCR